MKKLAIAFAGLAAIGFSGVAFADEATKGPAAMTDSEMDGVTAAGKPNLPGFGVGTAMQASGGKNSGTPPFFPNDKGVGKATNPGPANPRPSE